MRRETLALVFALLLPAALLAGCGTGPDTSDAGEAAGDENDPYAYLADFSYSALFDENGYVPGVTALDYVTLPEGYAAPALPAGTDTVSDEDVETYITGNVLPDFMESAQVTDRAAEMGDIVNVDYVGSVDGVEFEGGSTGGNGTTLQLTGTNYIDDFEQQIAGHTPGETFDVLVTFPDPYKNDPDLAGKEAKFVTTLNYIVEQTLPELTDDFVAGNLAGSTGCQTVDELREYFKDRLLFSQRSNAVYDLLDAGATYADELPQALTDYFTDMLLFEPWQYANMSDMGLEEYIVQSGYESVEQYLDGAQQSIASAVRQVLLTQAIAEDLGLTCDSAVLERDFETAFGGTDMDALRDSYGEGYLKMALLERMTMEKILENATYAKE